MENCILYQAIKNPIHNILIVKTWYLSKQGKNKKYKLKRDAIIIDFFGHIGFLTSLHLSSFKTLYYFPPQELFVSTLD